MHGYNESAAGTVRGFTSWAELSCLWTEGVRSKWGTNLSRNIHSSNYPAPTRSGRQPSLFSVCLTDGHSINLPPWSGFQSKLWLAKVFCSLAQSRPHEQEGSKHQAERTLTNTSLSHFSVLRLAATAVGTGAREGGSATRQMTHLHTALTWTSGLWVRSRCGVCCLGKLHKNRIWTKRKVPASQNQSSMIT